MNIEICGIDRNNEIMVYLRDAALKSDFPNVGILSTRWKRSGPPKMKPVIVKVTFIWCPNEWSSLAG